jgi:hypothetical protein
VRVDYGISDQVELALSVPAASGTESREEDDGLRHSQLATGLGDVAVVASAWLLNPLYHGSGNQGRKVRTLCDALPERCIVEDHHSVSVTSDPRRRSCRVS